jgi:type II secretion system protein I
MSAANRQKQKKCYFAAGFTLIEVLVAMTILAAGILGVMGAFSLCIQANSHACRLKDAAMLARNELELAIVSKTENLETRTGTQGQYTWTVSFQEKEDNLLLASAVVNWSERGQKQTFTLSKIVLSQL